MGIKVACIGNMNNNMFSLVRYLRDLEIDANLLLFNKEVEHFLPQYDSLSTVDNFPWIKKLSWGSPQSFFITSSKTIKQDLENYDILIGCGSLPAFIEKTRLTLHIFAPYGGDLYSAAPSYALTWCIKSLWKILPSLAFTYYQRKGIKNALTIVSEGLSQHWLDVINYLNINDKYYPLGVPIIYSSELKSENRLKNNNYQFYDKFLKLREEYKLIVLSHSRHLWKTAIDKFSFKGNDILVKGFAKYISSGGDGVLILFEYGPDVCATKELVKNLEIQNSVVWFPKLSRNEIFPLIELSDFVGDQFIIGGIGGVGWEGIAMGKPVLCYVRWDPDKYRRIHFNKPFPSIVNVNTSEVIARHLLEYEKNSEPYKKIGRRAQDWFDKYRGIGLAKKWVYLISCIYEKKEFDIEKLKFD